MLIQRDPTNKNEQRVIKCGSSSLTSAQQNYSTIELECLAIIRGVEKCDFYLKGMSDFTIVTDHRPLLGIFSKPLHELNNQRLLRFRERIAAYNFSLQWNAGKNHSIADVLSRYPIFPGEEETDDLDVSLCFAVASNPSLQVLFDKIDDSYKAIVQAFRRKNNPKMLPVEHPARIYANIWSSISLLDDEEDTLLILSLIHI